MKLSRNVFVLIILGLALILTGCDEVADVSGTVISTDEERTVAGLSVKVVGTDISVQLDESGEFSLIGVPFGDQQLVVDMDGTEVGSYELVVDEEVISDIFLEATLPDVGPLSLAVLYAGEEVEGANVGLKGTPYSAKTDESGELVFAEVPYREYIAEIDLGLPVTLTGNVVWADIEEPLEGAVVTASVEVEEDEEEIEFNAITDENGAFSLQILPGTYDLTVEWEGYEVFRRNNKIIGLIEVKVSTGLETTVINADEFDSQIDMVANFFPNTGFVEWEDKRGVILYESETLHTPTSWVFGLGGGKDRNEEHGQSEEAFYGDYSVISKIVNPVSNKNFALNLMETPIMGGRTYKLSVWAKTDRLDRDFDGAYVRCWVPAWPNVVEPNPVVAIDRGTNDWTYYSNTIRVPSGGERISCSLSHMGAAGTVWWDYVVLVPVD